MRDLFTLSKKAFILLGLFILVFKGSAQVPEKFNYQLAVRDAQGNVYASQQVSFRVSILQGSTVLYQETHTTQTNANGLVNLIIGDGTPAQGSMTAIGWGGDPKSLKVEFDPAGGSSFAELATTPMLSVPYALHSKYSEESSPGGSNTQVQFNNNGTLGGSENLVFNPATNQVGIGTPAPTALLHTHGLGQGQGNVVFVGEVKIPSNQGDPPVSGAGTRMMWYPDKAAFRAGNVSGSRWDKDNIGTGSVAIGSGPMASGSYSVAMGASPTASGAYSTAFGYNTIASGANSTAMGLSTEASGQWSVALGNNTSASGNNSIAMGKQTFAQGENSATIGQLVGAYSFCETVIGYRNTIYTPNSTTSWDENDRLFVIGNGGGATSSNAVTVLKSGRTGNGTDSPQAGLHLKGAGFPDSFFYIESNAGNDAGLRIYEGPTAKWHIFNNSSIGGLQIYNTGGETAIFAKQTNSFIGIGNTAQTQALDVNGNARFRAIGSGAYAGVVNRTADGTLTTATSDIRFKENIQTLEGGLDKILQLRGVSFTWINNPEYGQRIGFIAQEFEKVIPELVFTNETDGFKGINYAEVSAVLVEAIKEQQTQIDRLQQESQQLNARLERLERALESLSEN